jgi:hypothetical protein
MSEFKKDHRVVVRGLVGNQYDGEHGKVIGEAYGWPKIVPVKLDNHSSPEDIPEGDLAREQLNPEEVRVEIDNVEKQVNQIADRLSVEMRTELPTHIKYFKEALESDDKRKATANFQYLAPSLQIVSESDSIPEDWWSGVEISLDKINWWIKTS